MRVVEGEEGRPDACNGLADARNDDGGLELGGRERRELSDAVGEVEDDAPLWAEERDWDERMEERPHERLERLRGGRCGVGRCDAALEGVRLAVRQTRRADWLPLSAASSTTSPDATIAVAGFAQPTVKSSSPARWKRSPSSFCMRTTGARTGTRSTRQSRGGKRTLRSRRGRGM